MSTLVTQLYLLEKYGPRLTTEQLAEVLTSDAGTILNQVSAGTFGVPTYVDGRRRFADVSDVAAYLAAKRASAAPRAGLLAAGSCSDAASPTCGGQTPAPPRGSRSRARKAGSRPRDAYPAAASPQSPAPGTPA